jgi:predicted ATP-grasp superfamily ATP-dependent carboligase
LKEELIEAFNKMTGNEMDTVDVLRKAKKIEDIDNYMY